MSADVPAAQSALSFYFPQVAPVHRIDPLGSGGGWSGSQLWRIAAGERLLCLRCWPREHPSHERLSFIHRVLLQVAPQLPVVAYPLTTNAGATVVEHAGHLWELSEWRLGEADRSLPTGETRLRAAMDTLARFHDLAAPANTASGLAPAIMDRHRLWAEMQGGRLAEIERSLQSPLTGAIDQRARRLLTLARSGLTARLSSALNSFASRPLLLQPAIRDIHREHVLFVGSEVTGIIDFGALRIDTPLTDVARLVGSLAGDNATARRIALDAYSERRSLRDDDRLLIDLLDRTGVVLGAMNWLTWLYVERRDMGQEPPIVRRLDEILARLEALQGTPSVEFRDLR